MCLIAVILPFTSNGAVANLFIFIIAIGLIFQSFEVVEFYFQSQVQGKIVSICKVIQLAFSSIIKIYLVLAEADLIWFVLVTAFDSCSLAVSYFLAYKLLKKAAFYKCFDFRIGMKLLTDSWPLILSSMVVMIYMRIDQIMLKEILGDYDVGIYSAAIRISEAWYFIPALITTSLFPAVLNAKSGGRGAYLPRLQNMYCLMVLISISVAVAFTFVSEWVINVLYGSAYEGAGDILAVHVWAGVFVSLGVARSGWIISENLQIYSMVYICLGAIFNVVGNYFFIPVWGAVGAAVITLLSQFLVVMIFPLFFTRRALWG